MGRRLHLVLPLIVLILGVGLRAWDPQPVREFRDSTFDILQKLQPRDYDEGLPVRIVAIDDASLARYGQWPWPRSLLARLVEKLADYGAAAVAFDVLFAEPDRSSPARIVDQLPAGPARQLLEAEIANGGLPDNDQLFAAAMQRVPVVLAIVPTDKQADDTIYDSKSGFSFKGESPARYVRSYLGAVGPIPELVAAAGGLGSIRVVRGSDGVVRHIALFAQAGAEIYPSLALQAVRLAIGARNILVKTSGSDQVAGSAGFTGVQAIRVQNNKSGVKIDIETDPNGELWLYDTGSQAHRYVSAEAVLDGSVDPALLAGNIVYVGATAQALFDNLATPTAGAMPGVELHAQATEQMLTHSYLSRPKWADTWETIGAAVVGLLILLCFAVRRIGAFWAAVLGFVLVATGLGGAWYAFTALHFLLDPVTGSAIGLLVYATAGITAYLESEKQRQEVRTAFGQYVSPDVVARIAENPRKVSLGGEARELTLLFCDVRGFTTLSEKLDPQALTRLINRFLTEMSDALLRSGGTIDKYMGDCVMGFWNAPLDVPHHPARACEAVLDMRRRLVALNEALAKEGDGALKLGVGIGVNSGNCSVGNMGSAQRLAYTAVGDNVNLASRLESLTRLYGVDCLVSEAVTLDAPDFTFLEVDRIRVKGRVQPVTVFALLGHSADLGQDSLAAVLGVKAFLEPFRAGDWAACEAALATLAPILGGTALAGLLPRYRERLDEMKDRPAPEGWDGVYTAREK